MRAEAEVTCGACIGAKVQGHEWTAPFAQNSKLCRALMRASFRFRRPMSAGLTARRIFAGLLGMMLPLAKS